MREVCEMIEGQVEGRAWKYGDDVNTDLIIAGRYLDCYEPEHLASHAMEDLDAGFAKEVRRGDVVQLLAESDHLKISTRGIAKEDGCPGERIRISNLRSRKIVYGQIIDARTARVEF